MSREPGSGDLDLRQLVARLRRVVARDTRRAKAARKKRGRKKNDEHNA